VFIEFKENSVHVLDGTDGAEFPLEREANGKITAASRAAVANGLRGFLQRNGVVGQRRAICALPARGVTLRTITLPALGKEDPSRLLAMQIEAQFPVAPSELAWGYTQVPNGNGNAPVGQINGRTQAEFVVAAVRRELLEDYNALLSSCGISPSFTLAALARAGAANGAASFGILEIGAERSELILFDERSVPALRVVNWGRKQGDNVAALRSSLPNDFAPVVYVSSAHGSPQSIVAGLGSSRRAEVLPIPQGQGLTAATHGLRTLAEQGRPPLLLGAAEEKSDQRALPEHWKWAAAAVFLLLLALSLRYADAMLFRSQLTTKLNELTKYRKTLPNLEKELSFLTFIKTNQPPYLDTLAVLSSAAPPGTRFDQVQVVRRGDVSVRGSVQDAQGPEKFRTKLIDSGFFSKVVVEEQGPASQQEQNKINFRVSAVLKPEGARKVLPPEPPLTNKTGKADLPMPGSFPPGMQPNMPPPEGMPMPPGAMPSRRPRPVPPNS
jgi:hypothetical protein